MESDDPLVRRARQGDREAFEELVRRTSRLVYAKLYLETGHFHEAEDLVQETYMRAYRAIGSVPEAAGFRPWLLSIARSVAVDHYRQRTAAKRTPPRRTSQEVLANQPVTPRESRQATEQREKVRSYIQSLPEDYRMPLMLRYIDGADYETITLQLGLSNGSLRGILHRGLKLLRSALTSEAAK